MLSYQYRHSHYKDKTVSRLSYLYNGIPYTWKYGPGVGFIKAPFVNFSVSKIFDLAKVTPTPDVKSVPRVVPTATYLSLHLSLCYWYHNCSAVPAAGSQWCAPGHAWLHVDAWMPRMGYQGRCLVGWRNKWGVLAEVRSYSSGDKHGDWHWLSTTMEKMRVRWTPATIWISDIIRSHKVLKPEDR